MVITDFNVAIVEGDSHLSKWVLEQKRLDIADDYCQLFKRYIPEDGVVIDIGACIGDHTVSYAKMVGYGGHVEAFEPNAEAFECLLHNTEDLPQVLCWYYALGKEASGGEMERSTVEPDNLGAMQVKPNAGNGSFRIVALDELGLDLQRIDFIKIDAEGMEPDILAGARKTILKFKPVMLIEVNKPVLKRRGKTADDILNPLREMGYRVMPSESHHSMDMETLDVLAVPITC